MNKGKISLLALIALILGVIYAAYLNYYFFVATPTEQDAAEAISGIIAGALCTTTHCSYLYSSAYECSGVLYVSSRIHSHRSDIIYSRNCLNADLLYVYIIAGNFAIHSICENEKERINEYK
ncbi:MAG: hypothetical protein HXL74_04585 [[Eubacterium] brachy]|nr:hypothetical protein [[Eubacterium] brachy]